MSVASVFKHYDPNYHQHALGRRRYGHTHPGGQDKAHLDHNGWPVSPEYGGPKQPDLEAEK